VTQETVSGTVLIGAEGIVAGRQASSFKAESNRKQVLCPMLMWKVLFVAFPMGRFQTDDFIGGFATQTFHRRMHAARKLHCADYRTDGSGGYGLRCAFPSHRGKRQ